MKIKLILLPLVILILVASTLGQQARDRGSMGSAASHTGRAAKKIRVAFLLSEGAVMIDFAGPWEVFQDVMIPTASGGMEVQHPFELYTVSESIRPFQVSGGMRVIPDYTLSRAPKPNIVVVPEQDNRSPVVKAWLRKMAEESDYVMSVCTGAFILAEAGLLDRKNATTHHAGNQRLQNRFPTITVERARRYVQADQKTFTSGGLSSGIQLALHMVELYFGRDLATATARHMEFADKDWIDGVASVDFASPVEKSYPSDTMTGGVFGKWQGTLMIPDGRFNVALHIWPEKGNTLGGILESVNEDTPGLPLAAISLNANRLHFEVPSVGGAYEGTVNSEGSTIEGNWTKAGTTSKLVLTRILNAPR